MRIKLKIVIILILISFIGGFCAKDMFHYFVADGSISGYGGPYRGPIERIGPNLNKLGKILDREGQRIEAARNRLRTDQESIERARDILQGIRKQE
jgi:hypothetical protein